ncbi:MAG: hypothetical protein AAGG80_05575, partial [Pseudomonadota bacterium]
FAELNHHRDSGFVRLAKSILRRISELFDSKVVRERRSAANQFANRNLLQTDAKKDFSETHKFQSSNTDPARSMPGFFGMNNSMTASATKAAEILCEFNQVATTNPK